ncbi:carbohydrate esterase family 16 protein [Ceratobasidium sp. AG-Ba]|nr:carbohydrate esterase family 16 protein [Ceratobasidium sp. AG-Ba]
MSRPASPPTERVNGFASERIEMRKYHDDEEITEREHDGLLRSSTPATFSDFRDSEGTFLPSKRRSRRRISHAQCSCIVFLSLILFALLFALFGPSDRLRSYLPASPSNVTNTSSIAVLENPCGCGTAPFGSALCTSYTAPALERSRLFSGTGARTRRFLDVASRRPVKVGILGGSVSACHGVDVDSMGKSCYARRIVDWMRERLYNGKEDGVIASNGAIGGMDSSYYAFCGTHHVPQDVDLLILEFDVNDQPYLNYTIYFDQLLRIALEFPNEPAVLVVGAWGPQLSFDYGYMDPSVTHLPAVQYYELTSDRIKPLLYVHHLRYAHTVGETFWTKDYVHPNAAGHKVLGDLTIAYLEKQLCLLNHFGVLNETALGGGPTVRTLGSEPVNDTDSFELIRLPPTPELVHNRTDDGETTDVAYPLLPDPQERISTLRLATPYTVPPTIIGQALSELFSPWKPDAPLRTPPPPHPFCADANDEAHPLTPSDKYGGSHGWVEHVAHGGKHSYAADDVGARIVVEVAVAEGRVAVFYFRSETYSPGVAECWVDDNRKGAVKLHGHWNKKMNVPSVAYIDSLVTPGDHYVTCEVVDETANPSAEKPHHFRIIAIMAT